MELKVAGLFHSLQGESTWAGTPMAFVRLAGCPLECAYCDTPEARRGGTGMPLAEVLARVAEFLPGEGEGRCVEVTGGEPLAQAGTRELLRRLCDAGYGVLLETNGCEPLDGVDGRVHVIMDLKTPGSGMADRTRWENLERLRADRDEIKFVLTGRRDYDWAKARIEEHGLARRVKAVLLSPAANSLTPRELAGWMLEDRWRSPVRLQIQLHKLLWPQGEQSRGRGAR